MTHDVLLSEAKNPDYCFRSVSSNDHRFSASLRMTVPEIFVCNLQRKIPVNVVELQTFAGKAVRSCLRLPRRKSTDLIGLSEIFVWLISDRRMASLHRQFLRQSGPTDVLTFQHGEIFISVETARHHARIFRNSLIGELCLYIVHGLLHLHGFDDRNRADARKMERMQKRILTAATANG